MGSLMAETDLILEELLRLHPKSIDLSLDRVYRLLEKVGNPHENLPPVVHVAGTNGKGSVLAFLQALLSAHGKRVQRFTSPHLLRFHERINLPSPHGTEPISEPDLLGLLARVKAINADEPITFFEITTVAALMAFAESEADFCLLETGLGGRLDATNVVAKPALSIITPISFDHQRFLGSELTDIAFEKAGILKPHVPAVIGPQIDSVLEVLTDEAGKRPAPLFVRGQDYDVFCQRGRLIYSAADQLLDLPLPRHLIGRHQIENAGIALAAGQQLLGHALDPEALAEAMKMARWPARMQRLLVHDFSEFLFEDDELWLDGGHNPAAGEVLAEIIADFEEKRPRPLHLIVGMMAGKDVRGFLQKFHGLASQVIAVPIPDEEGAMRPDDLADLAVEMGFEADRASSLSEALQMSASGRHEAARILICGSLYLAGHVLGASGASLNERV